MTITLSRSDYDALWQQTNPLTDTAKQADAFEVRSQGYSEGVSRVPE